MLDFATDRKTFDLINRAANRAVTLGLITEQSDRLTCIMDLEAAYASCNPQLDFATLLHFNDSDFIHDIVGIGNHMNRSTGQLEDCFLPRCARPASE